MENIYSRMGQDLLIDEYFELLNELIELDSRCYDNGEIQEDE